MTKVKFIGLLLLIIGIAVVLISGYNWWEQRQAIQSMSHDELNHYLKYDRTVKKRLTEVPGESHAEHLTKGEKIGILKVPSIKQKYPVYWGTGPDTLKQGVGMHDSQWTVTPDKTGHILLAGHRDTVFTEMGDSRIGDLIYLDYKGREYVYQIQKIFITKADDKTVVVKKDKPSLTISTCYPFKFVGDAPYRYIIQSGLVKVG
ncbi:sortase A [Scopulibacillus darangshiensis]|uniref:Sortase A n=1 Tax=Scopulibacillus darangshiensis TaxID=442528 RepID=A0A4R2NU46_9BACL|nr:class D sortase [Scopulibacillus darangshiensis]TCP24905.1 sortase A [Scopulibacillus darangshiensis]